MDYQIDDGVPLPGRTDSGRFPKGSGFTGAVAALDVGQSVFAAGKKIRIASQAAWDVRNVAPQKRFMCRTVTENGVKGVRVWRLPDAEGGAA